MNYEITKKLIPGLPKFPYRQGIGRPEFVELHATGAWGGTDESNLKYEKRTWLTAFVHYFNDWDSIIQVADTDYGAYGSGPIANDRAIHQELVQTRDYQRFLESYKRYIWLAARNLHVYNLSPERRKGIWTHHDVTKYLGGTHHTDPDAYLAYHGFSVDKLISDVQEIFHEGKIKHVEPKPQVKAEYIVNVLRRGDSGSEVRELQKRLIDLGYDLHEYGADGQYGDETEAAVRSFQEDHGLVVDGIIGPRTIAALENAEAYNANSDGQLLRIGDRGSAAKEWQEQLHAVGFDLARDGIYGPNTRNATQDFQRWASIADDGIVGPVTREKMKWARIYPGHYIQRDDEGSWVEQVQRKVNVATDGIFGPVTEQSVRHWQRAHGLKDDGIVGSTTWTAMFNE
ncbi:MAG TPA: peptidoglycan-binding domain-containing protein [Bacillales bacterium]|nr:peptidoglycan-binding domain-containing protein [Bacillales bacterium]